MLSSRRQTTNTDVTLPREAKREVHFAVAVRKSLARARARSGLRYCAARPRKTIILRLSGIAISFPSPSHREKTTLSDATLCGTPAYARRTACHFDASPRDTLIVHAATESYGWNRKARSLENSPSVPSTKALRTKVYRTVKTAEDK